MGDNIIMHTNTSNLVGSDIDQSNATQTAINTNPSHQQTPQLNNTNTSTNIIINNNNNNNNQQHTQVTQKTDKTYKSPYCIAYTKNQLFNPDDDTGRRYVQPQVEPVNGKVWPPTQPPEDKPHRNTNQLQYLLKTVHKAVFKHKHAWPFETPVDTKSLKLPDYHTIIKRPMDLTTIKRRLENYWYYDAYECIDDFRQIFVNCYTYNKPAEDVVMMAQQVELLFLERLEEMPVEEFVIDIPPPKTAKRKQKGGKKLSGKYQEGMNPSRLEQSMSRTLSSSALLQNHTSGMNIDGSSNHSQLLDSTSPALSNSNQSIQYPHEGSHLTSNNIASQSQLIDSKPTLSAKAGSALHPKSSATSHESNNMAPQIHLSNHSENSNLPSSLNVQSSHGIVSPNTPMGKNQFLLIV